MPFRHLLLPLRGFSLVYLLLSFLLPLLPAVPLGSSSPFGGFPPSLSVMALAFFGGFSSYRICSHLLGSSLCVTSSAPVGVPFHASSAYSSSWPHSDISLRSSGSPP